MTIELGPAAAARGDPAQADAGDHVKQHQIAESHHLPRTVGVFGLGDGNARGEELIRFGLVSGRPVRQGGFGAKSSIDSDRCSALRLLRFQYRYPGTPISTIAVPQNASVGRVMIVFSVHAAPIST